jgi:hypothetical protein
MPPTIIERTHNWSPAELRQLPADQRDAILAATAARAEVEYRNDAALIAFEAFGEEDLYPRSSDTRTR